MRGSCHARLPQKASALELTLPDADLGRVALSAAKTTGISLATWVLFRKERKVRLRLFEHAREGWTLFESAQVCRRVLVRASEGQHQVGVVERWSRGAVGHAESVMAHSFVPISRSTQLLPVIHYPRALNAIRVISDEYVRVNVKALPLSDLASHPTQVGARQLDRRIVVQLSAEAAPARQAGIGRDTLAR